MATTDASSIRVMPELLVRKIAAGEVVERPASVVKELVENALDAHAQRISVALEDGGKQLIRVTDNGTGMTAEDLRLAVTPHATSKVYIEQDLYHIETMGFRGEALASISAVSRMRVVSRPAAQVEGHEIRVAAEEVELAQAAGCPAGTTVEVRDLFFNVPARRKFLRTNSTETGHASDQFVRIALAYPQVTFELMSGNRRMQNLPACADRRARIAQLYSQELADDLLHIERAEEGLTLDAYAAPPARSRATAQWQFAFVNGRYIRDRFVQHAVKEAYRGLVDPHRHAVIFLFLEIDPQAVDVNVHPTKIEVRWANSGLVHSQVLSALRETFQRADLTPALHTGRALGTEGGVSEDDYEARRQIADLLKATPPVQPSDPPRLADNLGPVPGSRSGGSGSSERTPSALPSEQAWRSLYGPASGESAGVDRAETPGEPNLIPPATPAGQPFPAAARAIQMHNLYLVTETADGIMIIDQHALHERIMYEELRHRLTEGKLEAQRLLLPETLKLTPAQAALLEAHADLLDRLGLELTPFGPDAVAIHAFPLLLRDADVLDFMHDLLDNLAQHASEKVETEIIIHELLDMMACKAAVKAGDSLSEAEITALLERKDLIEKSSSCPHGRPTMLRLSRADLERQFKRT